MPLIQSLIDKYESGNKDLTEEEVNILNASKIIIIEKKMKK